MVRLREISSATGLSVPPGFVVSCESFLVELMKWNRRTSLISRADEQRVVERHVLDSLCLLSVESCLCGKKILDVGTGAGFPGLILAMWEPEASVFLLESKSKKVAFLKVVRRTLSLRNTQVVEARVEQLAEGEQSLRQSLPPQPVPHVDIIVSRAVGEELALARALRRILVPGGFIVLYKGAAASRQLEQRNRFREIGFEAELVRPAWQALTTLVVLRNIF